MPASQKNFELKQYSNLVTRRNYSKIQTNFNEPDLLEIQKNSYNKFIESEIESVIKNYFPVKHAKNNKFEVRYNGLKFLDPVRSEEQARTEGRSYERALYVDLDLINNETGEIKKSKKSKNSIANGIFFANIPIMTEKGTFIINGIEKFVISQIVRSPGAYILSKTQIKLNSKKKVNEGYICEILPARGTLINFILDEKTKSIDVMMRNSIGDNAPSFPATQLLKAFGMSQDEILRIYNNDEFIVNTLAKEPYNHESILGDYDILSIRQAVNKIDNIEAVTTKGSPIEYKLKTAIWKLKKNDELLKELNRQNDTDYDSISLKQQKLKQASPNKKASSQELDKLISKSNKLHDKIAAAEQERRRLLDIIITEKAAKSIIGDLSISTKSLESMATSNANSICYQDVIIRHFMENRQYDLTSAGRHKITHKMRITERLYQTVLAQDIVDKKGHVLVEKNRIVSKDEIDLIKKSLRDKEVSLTDQINLTSQSYFQKNPAITFEKVYVYPNNENRDIKVPVIGIDEANQSHALTLPDFLSFISYVIGLVHDIGKYDDIDHLGNKRLRLIHEQLRNKLQVGMARVEKHIKEKLASISIATANDEQQKKLAEKTTIKSVVNTKAFQLIVKNFFNSYQLTQFIDQQNPLSELTNKRRISAMGDGGISREDPNLDIRDVHYSHYGRICPIETPEGMNIGLIMSLAAFTKVDPNGFLITPYRRVVNGVIQDEIVWMNPLQEDEYVIIEATVKHDEKGKILQDKVVARYRASQELFDVKKVDFIEISPRQVVSIAAGCIPFLEHDDTTRALMGANMQRQAVPLVKTVAPIVGTGSEYKIAHDSGMTVVSKTDGTVKYADANKIVVVDKNNQEQIYDLIKFNKSNQDTCINQTPIVELNQKVKVGDTLTDGPSMHNGELALGRNPLIAFTTWSGYNFEDAIIISERLVRDDVYTSISISEYTIECLRTKNGDEEITRELPNVSEESKRYLDEDGIIMVGAEVKEGDILVGKISPKGVTDFSPEEKLLQQIFGNKTKNVRDSSLKVPHGGEGIVAKVQRFSITNGNKRELNDDVIELIKVFVAQKRKLQIGDKMSGRHGNKGIVSIVVPIEDMPHLEDGTPIDIMLNPLGVPSRMNIGQIIEVHLGYALSQIAKKRLLELFFSKASQSAYVSEFGIATSKVESLINSIKKYCKQQSWDTLEKAQANLKDVDLRIILSNVGLNFEDLNLKAATPVFAGASLDDVASAMQEAGIDPKTTKGKFKLIDGRTGEYFDGEVTVGIMYMMKLDHMVDDKIHARAVGPYSKITQQPLGGKSQNGGQRFGEMEVWALEAYGAAHNLREILTIKSDDVKGRNLTYSAIVKGKALPQPSLPESFKLLTKQLQGLGLCLKVTKQDGNVEDINDFTSVISNEEEKDQAVNQYQVESYEDIHAQEIEDNF